MLRRRLCRLLIFWNTCIFILWYLVIPALQVSLAALAAERRIVQNISCEFHVFSFRVLYEVGTIVSILDPALSRPWMVIPACQDHTFPHQPLDILHDGTRGTVQIYVHRKIKVSLWPPRLGCSLFAGSDPLITARYYIHLLCEAGAARNKERLTME